jgi:hypothetical protein
MLTYRTLRSATTEASVSLIRKYGGRSMTPKRAPRISSHKSADQKQNGGVPIPAAGAGGGCLQATYEMLRGAPVQTGTQVRQTDPRYSIKYWTAQRGLYAKRSSFMGLTKSLPSYDYTSLQRRYRWTQECREMTDRTQTLPWLLGEKG